MIAFLISHIDQSNQANYKLAHGFAHELWKIFKKVLRTIRSMIFVQIIFIEAILKELALSINLFIEVVFIFEQFYKWHPFTTFTMLIAFLCFSKVPNFFDLGIKCKKQTGCKPQIWQRIRSKLDKIRRRQCLHRWEWACRAGHWSTSARFPEDSQCRTMSTCDAPERTWTKTKISRIIY